jgi:hypothetical protein
MLRLYAGACCASDERVSAQPRLAVPQLELKLG